MRVARDTLEPIDGVPIALCPLLVTGEERGRFEGKQGEGGPEGIRERNIRLGRALIWEVVKASMHQPQERICGEMLASFGCNNRHGNPRQEDLTWCR